MSARARRRMQLMASLAGEDVPADPPASLPQRTPGTHYTPPAQRTDEDEEFFLCDGGFTEFMRAAAAVTERLERREELAP